MLEKEQEKVSKLETDLKKLMENLKSKPRDAISKEEKVIVESLSHRVNELENERMALIDKLAENDKILTEIKKMTSQPAPKLFEAL